MFDRTADRRLTLTAFGDSLVICNFKVHFHPHIQYLKYTILMND